MDNKLRRQIASQAARLLFSRRETDPVRAKVRAARQLTNGVVRSSDLPTNSEVRLETEQVAQEYQGGEAMRRLCDELDAIAEPNTETVDRFQVYQSLLLPLEQVRENVQTHPEGDALYHSLQVFSLARDEIPYDEEFLLAALLHDVGKGIDRQDHVTAGLDALEGFITERTAWLIASHSQGHAVLDGTIGVRARRRLEACESYDELMLLARCDRRGRKRGVPVPDVADALAYVRELDSCWE
jgi:predicted HD phosphohydrolase